MRPLSFRHQPSVRTFMMELLLIVLGVLAALSVDQWRQDRARTRHADMARAAISEELRSNRAAAAAALDYHERKLRALQSYSSPDSADRHPEVSFFERGFVSPAQLLETAWESARETGALEAFEYGQVLRLSKVYAEQRRYQQQTASVSDIVYGILVDEGPEGIVSRPRQHASLIGTFAWRERGLLQVYDEILPLLDSDPSGNDASAATGQHETNP